MERTAINPVSWSIELGFDQAELVQGHGRLLVCSAQDAMDADGTPQHPGDLVAQLELSLDNLEAVLSAADMALSNVVRLNFFTTDVDELFKQPARTARRSRARLEDPRRAFVFERAKPPVDIHGTSGPQDHGSHV